MHIRSRLLSAALALTLFVGLLPLSAMALGSDPLPVDPDKVNTEIQDDPANPDKNDPANPDKDDPANPDKDDPANPDKNNPANPDKNDPANPDKNDPANPDKNDPTNPDKDNNGLNSPFAPFNTPVALEDGAYIGETHYATVGDAIAALSGDETITIVGSVVWDSRSERNEASDYWTAGQAVTIMGADETAQLVFSSKRNSEAGYDRPDDQRHYQLYLNGDLSIDGVEMDMHDYNTSMIYANGHTLYIGSQVTRKDGSNWLWVFGGAKDATVESTNLILEGFSYTRVFGGGRNGGVTGDVNMVLGSSASATYVYGGGYHSTVEGNIDVTVDSNAYVMYLTGGAYRSDVQSNINLTVHGEVHQLDGGSYQGGVGGDVDIHVASSGTVELLLGGVNNNPSYGLIQDGSSWGGLNDTVPVSIDYETMQVMGDVTITADGFVSGLYGGGYQSTVGGDVFITMNGSANTVHGGGMQEHGNVAGNVTIVVNGSVAYESLSNVYVGGAVYGSGSQGGYVGGDTHITLNKDASAYVVLGSGDNASVKGSSTVVINGTVKPLVSDIYKDRELRYAGSVFGGGYIDDLDLGEQAMVHGGTNVTIGPDAVVTNVYGGGSYGNVQSTNVTVSGTVADAVYGGSANHSPGGHDMTGITFGNASVTLTDSAKANTVYAGGYYANVLGDAAVTLSDNSTVNQVFGSSIGAAPTYEDMQADSPAVIGGSSTITVTDNARANTITGFGIFEDNSTVTGTASVLFDGNGTAQAVNDQITKIENANQVTVTGGSHIALTNPESYTQLVNVENLTVNGGAQLALWANNHILGNYSGTAETDLGTLAIAAGSKLIANGTATGITKLQPIETPTAAALSQVYVVAMGGSAKGAFTYTDSQNRFALEQNALLFNEEIPNANLTLEELSQVTGQQPGATNDKWWLVAAPFVPGPDPNPDPDPDPENPGVTPITRYTVTVSYVNETGTRMQSDVTRRYESGSTYDVSDLTNATFAGYSKDYVEGDEAGTITGDVSVVVHYVSDSTITDPDTPLGNLPELPGDNDGNTPGDDVVIVDPNVPLGNLPNTGVAVASTLPNLALAIVVGCSVIALGKKKKDQE